MKYIINNKKIELSNEEVAEIVKQNKFFVDNLTLQEFAGIVNKSKRTISRKIATGKIFPKITKSKLGTLEYRFNQDNVKAFFWDELPLEVKANR